jgi:hypothetical protein
MQVAPGTAQEVPVIVKFVLVVFSITALITVSAWGKIWPWFIGLFRKK